MNACILNNPHARQNWNENKAFDRVKKEIESKWDKFQTQAQQIQEVWWPVLVCLTLTSDMLGIIGILAWGVRFIPQNAWAQLENHLNKQNLLMQNFSKLHGVLRFRHRNPISANEQKKWMQYQNIMIQKLFMDGLFAYLNLFFFVNIICIF
jgi:hypothetical protein